MAGTEKAAPVPTTIDNANPTTSRLPSPSIERGTGQFVKLVGLAKPRPVAQGEGTVTFNFENQPVEAVVKAILGDLLHENYSIVPGVQGNVSFSTSQPVTAGDALPILETLLSWTGNALVRTNGRYVVMPTKDAVPGNVVPSIGATAPVGGLQARLYPLHYISAAEMQKLIKPFARADSILLADPTRNVLVMAGTTSELENYGRTVKTFDVDWLKGMSVGVFSMQRAQVKELTPTLDKLFGEKGNTPMAGLLRFIPIERTNSLVVISPQSAYLEEVKGWIDRIDSGGGNEPQLYVYDVRNVQAADLADYLSDIYGSASGGRSGDRGGRVGPGLSSGTLGGGNSDLGNRGGSGLGSTTGAFGNTPSPSSSSSGASASAGSNGASGGASGGLVTSALGDSGSASGSGAGGSSARHSSSTTEDGVRIASVDGSNQVMVRCRPSQWNEIEQAIKRLDTVPLQVQIETRILEVALTGSFQFGVQWYLEGLVGGTNGSVGQPGNQQQWALGNGGNVYNPKTDSFFYSFVNKDISVAIRAMEKNGNTKVLSAPSLVVLNNQKAHIQVGDQIPITQTFVNTNANAGNTYGQVEYKDTGVILNVRPRVNPGGLVYMNVNQVVSSPGDKDATTGNFPIQQREVATQVAVQSGQTVLLGGLIKQNDSLSNTGIPGLNRIPIFGRLFGTTSRDRTRTELIVLITPRVISDGSDAKRITDEYQQKFESLRPYRPEG
ncbi:MAG: Type II secretion system protein D [Luteibacter sp.]|nr:MAG: Type II secretion system protein D [Luteibacter sp.]